MHVYYIILYYIILYYIISCFHEFPACFLQTFLCLLLFWHSCLRPLRLWRRVKLHLCVWLRIFL